jgi:DNA-binding IclR family transcriptional regulator
VTPAVLRTLRILDFLSRAGTQRLSDIGRHFALPKSNVHRLLQSLMEEGFVQQEGDTGRYFASMKVYELGAMIAERNPVRRAAASFVQQLHQNTGETVALAIMVDTDIVYIDRVLSPNPLRGSLREGWRIPAAFTAAGKVVLANHPDGIAMLDCILTSEPEARDLVRDDLLAEFEQIRERGYAVSRSGWTRGINSIACPVGGSGSAPSGALALVVPTERMAESDIPSAALGVMSAAAKINSLLTGS